MADIEAELLKRMPCHRFGVVGHICDSRYSVWCVMCEARPAVAEFCRGLVANQHDEDCDTRDAMIQGKPCNCYVLIGKKYRSALAKVAELEQENKILREAVNLNAEESRLWAMKYAELKDDK